MQDNFCYFAKLLIYELRCTLDKAHQDHRVGVNPCGTSLAVSSKAKCSFSKCKCLHLNETLHMTCFLITDGRHHTCDVFSVNESSETSEYY